MPGLYPRDGHRGNLFPWGSSAVRSIEEGISRVPLLTPQPVERIIQSEAGLECRTRQYKQALEGQSGMRD